MDRMATKTQAAGRIAWAEEWWRSACFLFFMLSGAYGLMSLTFTVDHPFSVSHWEDTGRPVFS